MSRPQHRDLDLISRLTEVGMALSAEKDQTRLLELILTSAKQFTQADGGTLYSRTEDDFLEFELVITDSLGIRAGVPGGEAISLPPIPLYLADGRPNEKMVAAKAAANVETVNIPDAYAAEHFDFSGTRDFDRRAGYRSVSFLTVPMRNHEDEVIGVLQLINALDEHDRPVPFTEADRQLVESLASQAAIALTNRRLIEEQRALFEAFIKLMAAAVDEKSPYTGGHCRRVPELTMMLAEAAAATERGPLAEFTMNEGDRYELKIASWLHDCGKVTTPEFVVDKGTKLETIFDRIHLLEARFEILKRDLEIAYLRERIGLDAAQAKRDFAAARQSEIAALESDCAFVRHANIGGEFMREEAQQRVRDIGAKRWINAAGEDQPFLSEDEIDNLNIPKGTLTQKEREVINHHIVATIKMLESLPYPKHLRRVPEFAGGHHERMDGSGYPKGLRREDMPVQARAMGIADIFEALTAADRPYKSAMPLSMALSILGRMKQDSHVDPDLFDVFVREKVYLRYSRQFLTEAQLDEVDESTIPGYTP